MVVTLHKMVGCGRQDPQLLEGSCRLFFGNLCGTEKVMQGQETFDTRFQRYAVGFRTVQRGIDAVVELALCLNSDAKPRGPIGWS